MTNPKFSFDLGRAASTASLASGCSPEGATERPHSSIFEQVNAIYDALLGPSRYQEVALLNHVADKLSDEGFAIAVTDPLTAYELLKISAELGEKAQRLDDELVAELRKFFEQEAN